MGAAWETVAFIVGALGAHNQQSLPLAVAHILLFYLAPLWINAFAYMTFARMVQHYLPAQRVWLVRGATLAKYFVLADMLAFAVQAVGAILASPGAEASQVTTGVDVYIGGIGLQEAFLMSFVALMVMFHREAAKLERNGVALRRGWKSLLCALYGVLFLITVCSYSPWSGPCLYLFSRSASSIASWSTPADSHLPTRCPSMRCMRTPWTRRQ
jgi:hypothetical protein